MIKNVKRIIISRADSIGDVVLTLPLCGFLKEVMPNCEIIFLGQSYTKPIIEQCKYVDQIVCWNEISIQKKPLLKLNADLIIHVFPKRKISKAARSSKISHRVGTWGRVHHYLNCNHLVLFSRKKSELHESQLNFKLLKPLGYQMVPTLQEIDSWYGLKPLKISESISKYLKKDTKNLIIHVGSKGSAVEWPSENFADVINKLNTDNYNVILTGVKAEKTKINEVEKLCEKPITNLCDTISLTELYELIGGADAVIAASTGPLHIAAALGKKAIGLYAPNRPIHPGRWAPVGKKAIAITAGTEEQSAQENINKITVDEVLDTLLNNNNG